MVVHRGSVMFAVGKQQLRNYLMAKNLTTPTHASSIPPMNKRTSHVGPLGSTLHVLRADAETVEALAGIEWNEHFRRVGLDPVRGLVSLMAPSPFHEELSKVLGDIVEQAGDILERATKGLQSVRLKRPEEPPNTGLEADCAFYIGESVDGFIAAIKEGQAEGQVFLEQRPPELVVEVELTQADVGKAKRYGQIGVRELWRLSARKDSNNYRLDFYALHATNPPRLLDVSFTLPGLRPQDVVSAVDGVRFGRTARERRKAITRALRQRGALRIREQQAAHAH